eukprot:CAMPEP_0172320798 /NCGR_PEP_ID=MMETSP1058-20130122/41458_1 /TAXON_ID=83371 /ORGANISM="Detonula confervacea, Strain CCMP 353" /LENGTH=1146 /DNA_ID=CAMNT_0013036145 /DNA_START=112 /DNA_END=3552 /DNA_ORIENTATION=-
MFGCLRRRQCSLLAALLLLNTSLPSAVAFLPSSPPSRTSNCRQKCHINNADRKWPRTISTAVPASNDENDEYEFSTPAFNDADSITRRRLVLSLLASTSFAPLAANAIAPSTTVANAATPLAAEAATPIRILKPPLDKRTYETYTLPNGLQVLLCSDPASTTSAVAMNVHVGACSDPVEIPGLAHFCEHMLFLGTELYPEEDSFTKFLSANGGNNNAFTDSEKTVYYFELDASINSRFSEALLRFGSFFSGPLFTESATARELNAIDSENSKNLQNDIFRLYELEKDRVNSEHPYSKFFTGNKETLLEGTKRQGINLRQQLVKFYEAYYSANQMSLAVVAPQSISQLKKFVSEGFGSIPNREVNPPEDKWAFRVPPYGKSGLVPAQKNVVEIVPIQELRQVSITWPIEFASKEDRNLFSLNKPDYFVGWLLGHEGEGSLLSYLKDKGWANSLGASDNANLSDFITFEVTVELTNKGLGVIDDVCETIFSYVRMLQESPIPDYVFDENLQLDELEWRYSTKGQPVNYVQSLVTAMDKFPPSLYIAGPRRLALKESESKLISSDDPRTSFKTKGQRDILKAAYTDLINSLTVDNSFLTVFSKTFEGKTSKKEKWYGTEYNVRPIPMSTLMRWQSCVRAGSIGLAYPRENVFIPSESGLLVKKKQKQAPSKALTFQEKLKPITPPTVIRDDGDEGRWTVYHKIDDRFGKPKAFLIFQLLTGDLYSTPLKASLASLYQTCAADKLNEYTYDARLADLSYDLQVMPRGVRLTFGGYNDKLKDFASYVSSKLARDLDDVLPSNEEEFERYKDNLLRAYSAFKVKQPYAHAIYYSSLTQTQRNFQYTNDQLVAALKETTLDQLVDYVKALWASGKGEALIQGNYDKKEALDFVDAIDKTLAFKPITSDQYPARIKALPLPVTNPAEKPTRLSISEPNPSNNNAAAHIALQCLAKSEKDHVLIEIISAIIQEPFYDDLRTKQQLGYIVSSGVKAVAQSRTLSVIVQSNVAPAEKVTLAMIKCLDSVSDQLLKPLTSIDIELFVKGLVDSRLEPDKQLAVEVTRNWSEISNGRFQYDRLQAEVAALLSITKQDIIDYWDQLYVKERRMLVSEIVPRLGPTSKEPALSYASPDGVLATLLGINDIEQLRANGEAQA